MLIDGILISKVDEKLGPIALAYSGSFEIHPGFLTLFATQTLSFVMMGESLADSQFETAMLPLSQIKRKALIFGWHEPVEGARGGVVAYSIAVLFQAGLEDQVLFIKEAIEESVKFLRLNIFCSKEEIQQLLNTIIQNLNESEVTGSKEIGKRTMISQIDSTDADFQKALEELGRED
ncbi:MAG: hypothetical protein ACFFC7_13250 [Candidatus Hermodarchaeota archaeon]